jgi:predicted permease
MVTTLLLLAVFALLGVAVQVRSSRSDALRDALWNLNYVLFIPLAATYALLSIELDRQLLTVVAVGIAAWWLTVAVAGGWARATCSDRIKRGAVWLAGAFPNTGFLGFPLAYLVFGTDGLRLAIIYDQISLVIPAVVVSTMIARGHGHEGTPGAGSLWRVALASPPLWTVAVLITLRSTVLPDPIELEAMGHAIGTLVGPYGFVLLGLSLPLGGFSHGRHDVVVTAGAVVVRTMVAPMLVLLVAWVSGVDVPGSLLLIAAMPTAFHALIIGRVNGLDANVLRLAIVISSPLVIVASIVIAAVR